MSFQAGSIHRANNIQMGNNSGVAVDPFAAQVVTFLHLDSSYADSSPLNKVFTPNDSISISNSTYKKGGGSLHGPTFPSFGNIYTPPSSAYDFGLGDYTIFSKLHHSISI